ncbi:MAG TPA: M20/M25/M40 family metallo-hydrolase, partial [Solirubrobacteraceae bacterium]
MTADELQAETTEVLQRLVRFNTVNPPGRERPAIEYLERYLREAGFETEQLAAVAERPNLVADLRGEQDGPTLCLLSHVDTVIADASEWTHDPWSGDVADGYLWGRGAIDMKSQAAAEAVAGAALARDGWRPARGNLKIVFTVDEETGGEVGASWITSTHPERVRCDMLLNEGAGESFEYRGKRHYGVCCAEKGIFRFTITAIGAAGHASLPATGDNALLKLGPVLHKLARQPTSFEVTEAPAALLQGIGEDPGDPGAAMERIGEFDPRLRTLVEPMFGVTLTPTMAAASEQMNVIPSRAKIMVDCRVPPGLGEPAARQRISQVLGEETDELRIEFIEQIPGNASAVATEMMSAIDAWVRANDSGATALPVILPGFSDSRSWRHQFPDCVAYGFFPQRYQGL